MAEEYSVILTGEVMVEVRTTVSIFADSHEEAGQRTRDQFAADHYFEIGDRITLASLALATFPLTGRRAVGMTGPGPCTLCLGTPHD